MINKRPKPWTSLLIFLVVLGCLAPFVIGRSVTDRILIFLLVPLVLAGMHYPRWVYLSMAASLVLVTVCRALQAPSGLLNALSNIAATLVAAILACELLRWAWMSRSRILEELRRAQFTIDNAPDAVFWVDSEAHIVHANRRLCELLGYELSEIIGRTVFDFDPVFPPSAWPEYWARAKRDGLITLQAENLRKDGTRTPVEIVARVFEFEGRQYGCVFAQDITERKRSEEALRRREATLEAVAFAAERFLRSSDWRDDAPAALEQLGNATKAGGVYIFRNHRTPDGTLLTSEQCRWDAPELPYRDSPQTLQNIAWDTDDFSRWRQLFESGEPVVGRVADLPEPENAAPILDDVHALALVPIFVGQEWWGFIGFDTPETDRVWSPVEVDALKTAAMTFGTAILCSDAEVALRRRETILEAVAYVAERFLRAGDWEAVIQGSLARLGEATDVETVYIFRNDLEADGAEMVRQVARWRRPGVEFTVATELIVGQPWDASGFGRWREVLGRGEVIAGRLDDFPEYQTGQKILHGQGSLALVPIFAGAEWWGFIGFDSWKASRDWSPSELDALRAAALIIGAAVRRKRADEERRQLERQIQHAQKLESLGVLAGGIAHDFNNLLMSIIGSADLALQDLPEDLPVRENLTAIDTGARRAADLCRQMLAYSGKGAFVVAPLNVSATVREMTHLLTVSLSKKVLFRPEFAEDLPAISADATQIRQVVMNLITNASEACGDRSGVVAIRTGAAECDRAYLSEAYLDEGLPEGVYVFIEVSDTGCGMDAEARARIFDPFYTTKFAGRGLGLAAVLGIVRGHGGAVKVFSTPGKGTTVRVLFPATAGGGDTDGAEEPDSDGWQGSGLVLLVDDEETVRALGRRMFERLGFTVITAVDGQHGVDLFSEHAGDLALLVVDMTMPRLSGPEALAEMRRMGNDVPVLLSSGYNEEEAVPLFNADGRMAFIQKPYRSAELVEKLKILLEN
ncbi:MAG: PAS domain S-box protein [bacterium]|nr:PAS domain S-box protein [bacterium]